MSIFGTLRFKLLTIPLSSVINRYHLNHHLYADIILKFTYHNLHQMQIVHYNNLEIVLITFVLVDDSE